MGNIMDSESTEEELLAEAARCHPEFLVEVNAWMFGNRTWSVVMGHHPRGKHQHPMEAEVEPMTVMGHHPRGKHQHPMDAVVEPLLVMGHDAQGNHQHPSDGTRPAEKAPASYGSCSGALPCALAAPRSS